MVAMPTNYNFKDLTGQVFERLTVISFACQDQFKSSKWLCRCECGNEITCHGNSLKMKRTMSCGCYNADLNKINNTRHGMFGTRFYGIWGGIIKRCTNKNVKKFKDYGERGISVSEEWRSFISFKNDMYESYIAHVEKFGEKETTIERNDVNGNYCLGNCSWATWKEQQNNRRNSRRKTA